MPEHGLPIRLARRARIASLAALAALALLAVPAARAVGGTDPAPRFDVERIAEGVYAVVRREPPGFGFEANSVFIVGERDVVVVDAQFTPSSTREVLAALRRLTPKPVKYVVATHWHVDHVTGLQVWRDSFPDAEIVAHAAMRADFEREGIPGRDRFVAALPGVLARFRTLLGKGESMAGGPMSASERAGLSSDTLLISRYLAEAPAMRPVLPTLTFEDRITLRQGARTIEVRHAGRGHTRGDAVVLLPDDGILVAGDLVVAPVPLVGTTSFPNDYGATLDTLLALRPRLIVPGHGPVMRDDAHVRAMSRMLASIRAQVAAAVARGETLEQARRSVTLDEFRARFAGDDPMLRLLFATYVADPAVARAFADAGGGR